MRSHYKLMQTSAQLLKQFEKLTSFEQALLTFLSIAYEPAHTTLILNCLKKMKLTTPGGNKPTTANLGHYFSKFEQLGLLTKEKQCAEEIVEILSKKAVKEKRFELYARTIQKEAPVSYYYGKWTTRCWRAIREMRIGLYTQQFDLIDDAAKFIESQCGELVADPPPTIRTVCMPFDLEWFQSLPASFQFYLLSTVLQYGQAKLVDYPDITNFLTDENQFSGLTDDEKLPFRRLLLNELLFKAKLTQARELVASNPESFYGTGALGTIEFLSGNREKSLTAFDEDRKFLHKFSGNKKVAFFGPSGLFYILALLQASETESFPEIADTISIASSMFGTARENDSYRYLGIVVNSHINKGGQEEEIHLPDGPQDALTVAFCAICQYWLNSSVLPTVEDELIEQFDKASQRGYALLTLLLGEVLSTIKHNFSTCAETVSRLREKTGIIPILPILEPEEPWKRSLQALIHATSQENESSRQTARLVWMVAFEKGSINLSPKEQKLSPEGRWSKGRPISLSRLYKSSKFTYLTSQDRKICATIEKTHNPETNGINYTFDLEKTLQAMIGHPHLYLADSPATPVEFVPGEPEILVEERGDNGICGRRARNTR
ncbi:MAG: hypothetical protein CR992_00240 [Desulfobacterales bacterium]|nr:MAG: hypothetical protein CR992_00240 [Desulfobacterales bacterium]